MKKLLHNKVILVLFVCTTITGVAQTLGNAYFGVFIFGKFLGEALKGYLNVTLIFFIAVLVTLVSPTIAKLLSKKYGTVPQLVFGTTLMAVLPLAYWYNPFLLSLGMATMIGIIGSSIVGLASGILINNELEDQEKKMYYASFPLIVMLPYVITVPLGSWLANVIGFEKFFLVLGLVLLFVVGPLYFSLLFILKRVV